MQRINQWEQEQQQPLLKNKALLIAYERDLRQQLTSLEKKFSQFSQEIQRALVSNDGKSDQKKQSRAERDLSVAIKKKMKDSYQTAISSMQRVLTDVKKADQTSTIAESFLLQGKEQGDKEAAVYLKALQQPLPSSSSPKGEKIALHSKIQKKQ